MNFCHCHGKIFILIFIRGTVIKNGQGIINFSNKTSHIKKRFTFRMLTIAYFKKIVEKVTLSVLMDD